MTSPVVNSAQSKLWTTDEDLIDFQVASPDVSRACSAASFNNSDDTSREHLLDSELSQLEEVLQENRNHSNTISSDVSVSVYEPNELLIAINDEFDENLVFKDDVDGLNSDDGMLITVNDHNESLCKNRRLNHNTSSSVKRSNSELLLDLLDRSFYDHHRSKSADNLELLNCLVSSNTVVFKEKYMNDNLGNLDHRSENFNKVDEKVTGIFLDQFDPILKNDNNSCPMPECSNQLVELDLSGSKITNTSSIHKIDGISEVNLLKNLNSNFENKNNNNDLKESAIQALFKNIDSNCHSVDQKVINSVSLENAIVPNETTEIENCANNSSEVHETVDENSGVIAASSYIDVREDKNDKDLSTVEQCLFDLDNYLQEYDTSYSDESILDPDNEPNQAKQLFNYGTKNCLQITTDLCNVDHLDIGHQNAAKDNEVPFNECVDLETGNGKSTNASAPTENGGGGQGNQQEFFIQNSTRDIVCEEPTQANRKLYDLSSRVLKTGGVANLAFDLNDEEVMDDEPFKKDNPYRNTFSLGDKRRSKRFKRKHAFRRSFSEFDEKCSGSCKNSYLDTSTLNDEYDEEYDEEIDWSWVQEIAVLDQNEPPNQRCIDQEDSVDERQVRSNETNSCDSCVDTLTCPQHRSTTTIVTRGGESTSSNDRSSDEAVHERGGVKMKRDDESVPIARDDQPPTETIVTNIPPRVTGSWLRSSMRRVRHFRLPNEPPLLLRHGHATQELIAVQSASPPAVPQNMDNATPLQRNNHRPTSAPNRLPFSQSLRPRISSDPGGNSRNSANGCAGHRHRSASGVSSRSARRDGVRPSGSSASSSYGNNRHHHRRQSRSASRPVASCSASRARSSSESSRSRRPRSVSSTDSSIESSVDTSASCSPTGTPTLRSETVAPPPPPRRSCDRQPSGGSSRRRAEEPNHPRTTTSASGNAPAMPDHAENPLGHWPHGMSSMLACLSCTLGLCNISRFAILSIHFGANFIVQFMILSIVFGIPLFALHTCLGQQLGAGGIDMWRISPIFQGVGIAVLMAMAFLGLYSIVGVSWMFVYFRDSFITKMDNYRWAEPFDFYRQGTLVENGTYEVSETVSDYFNGMVLQRYNLEMQENVYGSIKFQPCFNLAVVWVIVFVSLSKGLKSYGKVVFMFTLLPVIGTFVLCAKLLGLTPPDSPHDVFPETSWSEFFLNTKCWVAAFQESFLTWGVFGAAAMQIASHNKNKHMLQRDTGLVVVITFTILLLVAFLANTCVDIFHHFGYSYLPGSFENMNSYIFMRSVKEPLPHNLATTPIRYMSHSSLVLGERVIRPGSDRSLSSGYQPLRLATELLPATFALLGPDRLSPFWAVLFYLLMILFGIAQQLAIWYCVATGIIAIKSKVLKFWETTITFFSCAVGFVLGLPMTTEFGIYVVYFMDYCIGGTWWIALLYMLLVGAVFMVRGRPYSGDSVVTALFHPGSHACLQQWAGPLLSFTWNVVLPVALVVYCVSTFKNGFFRELYSWHHAPAYDYWPLWSRQLGTLLQLVPVLIVPAVAFIQSYRYLNNGPSDILDRIQLLYRPPLENDHLEEISTNQGNTGAPAVSTTTTSATITDSTLEDPPPKYTPPPSYTTATGARIAKMLRQSFRRSIRRIANALGESSESRITSTSQDYQRQTQPPPPDYAAVLVEMNHTSSPHIAINLPDSVPSVRNVYNSETNRSANNTLDRNTQMSENRGSSLTAADVANILRSSLRRSTVRAANTVCRSIVSEDSASGSLSAVYLVDSAAPINQDSMDMGRLNSQTNEVERDEIKSNYGINNSSSVI